MEGGTRKSESPAEEFVRGAAQRPNSSLEEYLYLLRSTKKWWLAPMLVVFLLFGLLMALTATPAAPFIYALF